MVSTDTAVRLPPVAAIRAAIEREQAMRALAGEPALDLNNDPLVARALLVRLRWPRNGARQPWRDGLAMLGGPRAPWEGVGNVVKSWSTRVEITATTFCVVWRKEPVLAHPQMRQWKSYHFTALGIAAAIVKGHIVDAYP
jgi:hypothetical protein